MRPATIGGVGALAAFVLLSATCNSAYATTWTAWPGADGGEETYCYDGSMSAAYQSQAYDAIAYLDSATDVNRNGGSCTTATDAVFLQYAAADGTRGVTYCDHYKTLSSGAVVCDKYLIWFELGILGDICAADPEDRMPRTRPLRFPRPSQRPMGVLHGLRGSRERVLLAHLLPARDRRDQHKVLREKGDQL